jgi:hypothetical protein
MNRKSPLLRLTAGLSLLLFACATPPPPALCSAEPAMLREDIPKPDDWFSLLLHGFDRQQQVAPTPTVDCSGVPVLWQEPQADECRQPGPEAKALPPPAKLTEEDLVMDETGRPGERLVWVVARRFSNGEGLGPVGWVERTEKGYHVRALGSLRAYPKQARLRLEETGSTRLLIAEGETCTEEMPPACRRMARVLPLRQGRFFAEAVASDGDGSCLGPAWFPLSREEVLTLPNGWHRRVEFTSTLAVKPEGVVLDEQVVMYNLDPHQPSTPPLLYRRAQAQRVLTVKDARLVGTSPSLWVRLMEPELREGARLLGPLPSQEPGEPMPVQVPVQMPEEPGVPARTAEVHP